MKIFLSLVLLCGCNFFEIPNLKLVKLAREHKEALEKHDTAKVFLIETEIQKEMCTNPKDELCIKYKDKIEIIKKKLITTHEYKIQIKNLE